MKNIHIIPTDKPSRIRIGDNGNFVIGLTQNSIRSRNDCFTNHHIYITSSHEEIKEGDWYYYFGHIVNYNSNVHGLTPNCKKIILTTDELYIHNTFPQYVQKIDDEFLEWFVKNPSCEEVGIERGYRGYNLVNYKIIIPKEEPKQERMYSEEEVYDLFVEWDMYQKGEPRIDEDEIPNGFMSFNEWFEQFKKK